MKASSANCSKSARPLRLEYVEAGSLDANPLNWRRHPAGQMDALRESLADDGIGWAGALLYNERTGHLVDGHARKEAVDPETIVPVLIGNWTDEAERKILLTLDPITAMAEADGAVLRKLLEETAFQTDGLTGVLDGLWAELKASEDARPIPPEADDVPAPPKKATTKPGNLWLLGDHRLLCGDATKAKDVKRVLDGDVPFMCVTDPPYGVNYDPAWRNRAAAEGKLSYAARRVGTVPNDDRADWGAAWKLFPGNVLYSWHPPGASSLIHAAAIQGAGFQIRMQIIWAKSNFPIGRGDYHVRHEPCWYAVRKDHPARRTKDRTQTTLWEINLDKNVPGGHSTQKPVECMARPIRNHEGGGVYDPFLGSGTTLIAAEQLGRRCFGIEIEPLYCDVIVRRWQKFTGRLATLDRTGKSPIPLDAE